MRHILIISAALLAVFQPVTAWADAGRDGGPIRVQTVEPDVAGAYVKTMLVNAGLLPKPPVKVSFSQSWLDAQPEAKGDEQWRCLSEALYFEARGETVKGQFAVGEVIVNRVQSSLFPGTLCAVIKQGTGRKYQCQFTYTCDGYKDVIREREAYTRVSKVARAVIDGTEGSGGLTDGATYYHTSAVRPAWARRFKNTARIGVHLFYRPNYRTVQSD